MKIVEKSCMDFVNVLAGKDAVPGGGGASALVGSIGMALGNMVGSLTVGKKKYADVEEEINLLMEKAMALQNKLLELLDEDARVFAPLAKAYGMPKETPEEIEEKDRVMEIVLKDACSVPLEIMKSCCKAIELHKVFAEKGSRLAVSDAGTGVIFCKSALQGASLNVFINTNSMKDRAYAEKINEEADKMMMEYTVMADEVFALVYGSLRK